MVPCQSDEVFHCDGDNQNCIPQALKCNGISECSNGRDESVKICGCLPHEFQCNETTCVDLVKRCDTFRDCEEGEDEMECESYVCPPNRGKCNNHLCVPKSSMCNFVDDCGDNSDEVNCKYRTCYMSEFHCNNSQCIPDPLLCDGVKDCLDGSDEIECESHFQCSNGLYVHKDKVCDSHIDCLIDHDDETNCGECTNREYQCENGRCIDAANKCDGICDCVHNCDDENECDSLLCPWAEKFLCRKSQRCIQKEFLCDGFNDCKNTKVGSDEFFCWNISDKCAGFSRLKSVFTCPEGRCLPSAVLCDHVADCLGGEDEINCIQRPSQESGSGNALHYHFPPKLQQFSIVRLS
ncbi:G-protein coupled receptor GRL101 [Acanthosepion pharaonis]|uniref:G-protein coupled receptor GRL101 n=1 Tax=Acanthosepion pharaonis TaxID=158019 RepID=A0A812D0M7_ACAPH|nr:G-protein coupled receptor GRL101 [Sepia pharaonis]